MNLFSRIVKSCYLLFFFISMCFMVTSCGGGGGGSASNVSSSVSYGLAPIIATVGKNLVVKPTVTGSVNSFSILPALPSGLEIDPGNGVISGNPSVSIVSTRYTVTAEASEGPIQATLILVINPAPVTPPSNLSYSQTNLVATVSQAIVPIAPSVTGTVDSYWADPPLPLGLDLNPKTGVISGKPRINSLETEYWITAQNLAGFTRTTITIRVDNFQPPIEPYAEAPERLFAQNVVICGARNILASVPPQKGAVIRWTLSSGTATVEAESGNDGNVFAYRAGITSGTYTLSVDVTSPGGSSFSETRVLGVVSSHFLKDVHTCKTRVGYTATVLGSGRILVSGGNNGGDPIALAELYDPSTATWSSTGSMIHPRSWHTAVLLDDGRVLVAGGDSSPANLIGSNHPITSAELYDPATGTWSEAASLAVARHHHTALLLADGKVLAMGGIDDSGGPRASSELYDPASNTWNTTGYMVFTRAYHTSTMLPDGTVLVAGGYGINQQGDKMSANTAERYNPLTGTWSETGQMAESLGRRYHTATLLPEGRVLVCGGIQSLPSDPWYAYSINSAEIFDPSTGQWAQTNNLTLSRGLHTANLLPNGLVLVAGGSYASQVPPASGTVISSELFDPLSRTWAEGPVMCDAKAGHTATSMSNGRVLILGSSNDPEIYDPIANLWTLPAGSQRSGQSATKLSDGQVLIAGGANLMRADLYDPRTSRYSPTGNMLTMRSGHIAIRLTDGQVLVAGGRGVDGKILSSVERFNPVSGMWGHTDSLSIPRTGHAASLLADGRVLVTGGETTVTSGGDAGIRNSAELYDPVTGVWSATGSMTKARSGHVATILADGRVLVMGGSGDQSSEIYDPSTETWSATMDMVQMLNSRFVSVRLASGQVLVAGGVTYGDAVEKAALFNPSTGSWSSTGSLAHARLGAAGVLLPDGRVLVVGGGGGIGSSAYMAEVYDPVSGTWSEAGYWNTVYATLILLDDGSVMALSSDSIGFWKQ